MNPKAERWLELANEDIEMADYALSRSIFRQTCFHGQQAVEKALKGSHSLEQMLLYDAGIHTELLKWRTPCRNLDRFYIPTRYADALPGLLPAGEPTETDAQDALNDAKAIVTEIREKVDGKK